MQTCGQSRLLRQIERNLQLVESQSAANNSSNEQNFNLPSTPINPMSGATTNTMLDIPLSNYYNKSPSPTPLASSSRFDDLFGFQSQFQDEVSSILDLAASGTSSQGGTNSSTTPPFIDSPMKNNNSTFGPQASNAIIIIIY